jgi:hypothetical protein
MFTLRSQMSALVYEVEPTVDYPDTDVNDAAFVRARTMIGGRTTVEEFLACGMYHSSVGFGFMNVIDGTTVMSKVEVPLPVFLVSKVNVVDGTSADRFLVKVETNAERILGSYKPMEHDACMATNVPNGSRLIRVFEQMGVPCAP